MSYHSKHSGPRRSVLSDRPTVPRPGSKQATEVDSRQIEHEIRVRRTVRDHTVRRNTCTIRDTSYLVKLLYWVRDLMSHEVNRQIDTRTDVCTLQRKDLDRQKLPKVIILEKYPYECNFLTCILIIWLLHGIPLPRLLLGLSPSLGTLECTELWLLVIARRETEVGIILIKQPYSDVTWRANERWRTIRLGFCLYSLYVRERIFQLPMLAFSMKKN
jgi:hypothetical protein